MSSCTVSVRSWQLTDERPPQPPDLPRSPPRPMNSLLPAWGSSLAAGAVSRTATQPCGMMSIARPRRAVVDFGPGLRGAATTPPAAPAPTPAEFPVNAAWWLCNGRSF